jgi:serralysin
MSDPAVGLFPITGDAAVDASTNGSIWVLNNTRTVTWGVSSGFNGEFWNNPGAVAQFTQGVLNTFSYYADVNFSFNGYHSDPGASYRSGSDLNVSLSGSSGIFPSNGTWAIGGFPSAQLSAQYPYRYSGQEGDVFLNINSEANYLPSYAPGSQGWFLLMHELGHAVGLKHTHDNGGTGRPTLSNIGMPNWDRDWFSVMSYEDDYRLNQTAFDPATPMALDVIGLQYMYGINWRTNATDTTYDLSIDSLYQTLWDAGGRDTVSARGSAEGWRIILPYWQFSTIVTQKFGYALPLADVSMVSPRTFAWFEGDMENVRGSNYADELYGNQLTNNLRGYAGNDFIDGGIGSDTLYGGAGIDTLYGRDGSDIFVFDARPSKTTNKDRIADFNVKFDSLWLDNAVFGKLGQTGTGESPAALKKAYFKVGAEAGDRNDYVIYNKKSGVLSYDADGSGSGAAVDVARLNKNLSLTNKDLFVV